MRNILYHEFHLSKTIIFWLLLIFIVPIHVPRVPLLPLMVMIPHSQRFDDHKIHSIINSFPNSRTQFVVARFLFLIAILLVFITLFSLKEFLFYRQYFKIKEFIFDFSFAYGWILFYLPLYFRFDWKTAMFIFIFLCALMIFIPLILIPILFVMFAPDGSTWSFDIPWLNMSDPLWLLSIKLFFILFVATIISLSLSIRFYKIREF